jgi:hypothetical protein
MRHPSTNGASNVVANEPSNVNGMSPRDNIMRARIGGCTLSVPRNTAPMASYGMRATGVYTSHTSNIGHGDTQPRPGPRLGARRPAPDRLENSGRWVRRPREVAHLGTSNTGARSASDKPPDAGRPDSGRHPCEPVAFMSHSKCGEPCSGIRREIHVSRNAAWLIPNYAQSSLEVRLVRARHSRTG